MREDVKSIRLPLDAEARAGLEAGDAVVLSGVVYTARDATHVRIAEYLAEHGSLPFGLSGATLFYAGPTPPRAGRVAGAVGPTTASRMDAHTPALLEAGIAATIGKGPRSEEVRAACAATGSVYFAAVGGVAALLAMHVTSSEVVGWPELGTEALVKLTLEEFPAFVAIDARGGNLYAESGAGVERGSAR